MKKISIVSNTKRFYILIVLLLVMVFGFELYTLLYVRHIYNLKSRFDSAVMTFNPGFYDQELKKLRPIIDEIENLPFARIQDINAVKVAFSESANLNESNLDALKLSISNLFNDAIIDLIKEFFLMILLFSASLLVAFYIFVLRNQGKILKEIENLSADIKSIFKNSQNIHDIKIKEFEIIESSMKAVLEIYEIYEVMRKVTAESITIEDLTREMYENLKDILKFNRVSFASVEDDRIVAFVAFTDSKVLKLKSGFSQKIGENSLGKIKKGEIRYIKDLEEHLKEHPNSQSTRLIVEEGMRSSITIPIFINDSVRGFLFMNSFKKDGFKDANREIFDQINDILNIAYQKTILTTKLVTAVATSFTALSEKRDEETGAHIIRMATYSRMIAEGLSYQKEYASLIDENLLNEIYRQAPLHDIGKIGIPDYILLKKGKLTAEEFEIMKTHTIIGYEVLEKFDEEASKFGRNFFTIGKLIARYHHERWDGKGYPDGLAGGKIPFCARIVAVGDVLDALTTRRPYKAPFDFETSFSMILSESGTHFDPSVIKAFEDQKENIRNVYEKFKRANPSEYI